MRNFLVLLLLSLFLLNINQVYSADSSTSAKEAARNAEKAKEDQKRKEEEERKRQEDAKKKEEAAKKKQQDEEKRKQEDAIKASQSTLEKITPANSEQGYSVRIEGKGSLEYKGSLEDNPPKLTFDFANTKKKTKDKYDIKENKYVSSIKTEEFTKDDMKHTRLIVVLKSVFDYKLIPVKGGYSLELSVPAPKPVQKPAPINTEVVIGPEDLLEITVFDLPQFNATSRVAGDGTITMPLIGSVEVRGMTKKQVEQKIATSLEAKYINNANVSVNIKEYKSRQVSVLGAVKTPGPYYIISHRTLLQLLSEAGGLTSDATNRCYIFRENGEKIDIDLHDLMVNGNQNLNVDIYPGDVVNFPTSVNVTIYVLGAVKNPGAIDLTTSMPVTLVAAIAKAGGPTDSANKTSIQIRRKSETGEEKVIKANLKDILSGKAPDVTLEPGDTVNVPESFF